MALTLAVHNMGPRVANRRALVGSRRHKMVVQAGQRRRRWAMIVHVDLNASGVDQQRNDTQCEVRRLSREESLVRGAVVVALSWWWAFRYLRAQVALGKTLADLRALSPTAL